MKEFEVQVITPSKSAYTGKVVSITIPGSLGNFQVLYNHAPLMSSFEIGKIKIVDSNNDNLLFFTGGGTVEVLNNKVLLLAESFETPEEIDPDRAKKALERAKRRLHDRNKENIDLDRAELAMKRALLRLKICGSE